MIFNRLDLVGFSHMSAKIFPHIKKSTKYTSLDFQWLTVFFNIFLHLIDFTDM